MNNRIIPHQPKYPKEFGFIYVLSNVEMHDVYKIGMTTRSPHARAMELSKVTGVPVPFDVVYYVEVSDPVKQEKRVHDALSYCRVDSGREFFKAHLWTIIQAIQDPDTHFTDDEPPIHSEWSSMPMKAIEMSAKILSCESTGGLQ